MRLQGSNFTPHFWSDHCDIFSSFGVWNEEEDSSFPSFINSLFTLFTPMPKEITTSVNSLRIEYLRRPFSSLL